MKNKILIPYVDILRTSATYLVVALHCISAFQNSAALFGTKTWWVCNVVNSFTRMGVPIFFMISGFLLLSDKSTLNIKAFYKKRILKLAVPFIFWDIIYFIDKCVIAKEFLGIQTFFAELLFRGSKYHLWFVYQIIGIYLITPFIKKILDHSTVREIFWFFVVIILSPTIFRFLNVIQSVVYISPFNSLIEGYVGFFVLGYLLGTYAIPSTVKKIIYIGGFVGIVAGIFGNYLFSSPQELNLIFNEGYFITQYMTSAAFFLFVREISKKMSKTILNLAHKLSKLSFGIYLSHILILELFSRLVQLTGVNLSPAQSISMNFLVVSILCTLMVYIFSKNSALKQLI